MAFNYDVAEYTKDLANVNVLSHAQAKRQYKLMRQGDINARNALIESSLKWAKQLVSSYSNKYNMGAYYEDLLQDFSVVLVTKIDNWRPHKGKLSTFVNANFMNFVRHWHHTNCLREMIGHIPQHTKKLAFDAQKDPATLNNLTPHRRQLVLSALPMVGATYMSTTDSRYRAMALDNIDDSMENTDYLGDCLDNHCTKSIEDDIKNDRIEEVSRLLELLTPKERELINLYYFQSFSTEQIGKLFGVTKAAISFKLRKIVKILSLSINTSGELVRNLYSRNCGVCNKLINYKSCEDYNKACTRNTKCRRCMKRNKCVSMN